MSDTSAAMREFRFLDEKRKGAPLSEPEEARYQELWAHLGMTETPPQAEDPFQAYDPAYDPQQGYYAQDGQWYPYPEGYVPPPPQGSPGDDPNAYAYPQGEGYPPPTYDPNGYAYPQGYGFDPNAAPGYVFDPNQAGYVAPQDPPADAYPPLAAYGYPGYPPAPSYPSPEAYPPAGVPLPSPEDPNALLQEGFGVADFAEPAGWSEPVPAPEFPPAEPGEDPYTGRFPEPASAWPEPAPMPETASPSGWDPLLGVDVAGGWPPIEVAPALEPAAELPAFELTPEAIEPAVPESEFALAAEPLDSAAEFPPLEVASAALEAPGGALPALELAPESVEAADALPPVELAPEAAEVPGVEPAFAIAAEPFDGAAAFPAADDVPVGLEAASAALPTFELAPEPGDAADGLPAFELAPEATEVSAAEPAFDLAAEPLEAADALPLVELAPEKADVQGVEPAFELPAEPLEAAAELAAVDVAPLGADAELPTFELAPEPSDAADGLPAFELAPEATELPAAESGFELATDALEAASAELPTFELAPEPGDAADGLPTVELEPEPTEVPAAEPAFELATDPIDASSDLPPLEVVPESIELPADLADAPSDELPTLELDAEPVDPSAAQLSPVDSARGGLGADAAEPTFDGGPEPLDAPFPTVTDGEVEPGSDATLVAPADLDLLPTAPLPMPWDLVEEVAAPLAEEPTPAIFEPAAASFAEPLAPAGAAESADDAGEEIEGEAVLEPEALEEAEVSLEEAAPPAQPPAEVHRFAPGAAQANAERVAGEPLSDEFAEFPDPAASGLSPEEVRAQLFETKAFELTSPEEEVELATAPVATFPGQPRTAAPQPAVGSAAPTAPAAHAPPPGETEPTVELQPEDAEPTIELSADAVVSDDEAEPAPETGPRSIDVSFDPAEENTVPLESAADAISRRAQQAHASGGLPEGVDGFELTASGESADLGAPLDPAFGTPAEPLPTSDLSELASDPNAFSTESQRAAAAGIQAPRWEVGWSNDAATPPAQDPAWPATEPQGDPAWASAPEQQAAWPDPLQASVDPAWPSPVQADPAWGSEPAQPGWSDPAPAQGGADWAAMPQPGAPWEAADPAWAASTEQAAPEVEIALDASEAVIDVEAIEEAVIEPEAKVEPAVQPVQSRTAPAQVTPPATPLAPAPQVVAPVPIVHASDLAIRSSVPLFPADDGQAAFVEGEHRVVIHTVDGQVKRGLLRNVDLLEGVIPLEQQTGFAPERIPADRVKAIFFMTISGNRLSANPGQKIRVTFRDGRQVAGFSDDYQRPAPGFFLTPADNRTNTARIFIFRSSVQSVAEG